MGRRPKNLSTSDMSDVDQAKIEEQQVRAHLTQQRLEARQDQVHAALSSTARKLAQRITEMVDNDERHSRRIVTSISVSSRTAMLLEDIKRITGLHWGKVMDLVCGYVIQDMPKSWGRMDVSSIDDGSQARASMFDPDDPELEGISIEDAIKMADELMTRGDHKPTRSKRNK